MKFNGEIKFPELDHPGVPVLAVVDDVHFELVVENESLGRWSLYDVEASRLVASAFALSLDGEEVTFVAADPIDFAYRGVEHMAGAWAHIKSKRLPTRSMAIRLSRRDTTTSRVGELRAAMEANLESQARPRGIAGETAADREPIAEPESSANWDDRSEPAAIPVVGQQPEVVEPDVPPSVEDPLAEERQRLAEDRARLEDEIKAAEDREAVRLEAYKLEMERLELEREEARRQGELARENADLAQKRLLEPAPEPEKEPEPEQVWESKPEPEPESELEPEPESELDPEPESELDPEPEQLPEPEPEPVASVVDLNDYEAGGETAPDLKELPVPEPAMAIPDKDKASLMGAVRSAFARGGGKSHEHKFLEAPGGLGITRYVCEECGYVSISA